MDMEKNIIEIVNNVLNIIQKKEYYKNTFEIYDFDFKDLDNLWDFYRATNNKYKKKYNEYDLDMKQLENNKNLSSILNNYPIFSMIISILLFLGLNQLGTLIFRNKSIHNIVSEISSIEYQKIIIAGNFIMIILLPIILLNIFLLE